MHPHLSKVAVAICAVAAGRGIKHRVVLCSLVRYVLAVRSSVREGLTVQRGREVVVVHIVCAIRVLYCR